MSYRKEFSKFKIKIDKFRISSFRLTNRKLNKNGAEGAKGRLLELTPQLLTRFLDCRCKKREEDRRGQL